MEMGDLTWDEIMEEAGHMTLRPKYPAPVKKTVPQEKSEAADESTEK